MSLVQLCERAPGLVYRTLTQQRTRNIFPDAQALALIAAVLETSIDYLVSGVEHSDSLTLLLKSNPFANKIARRISKCDDEQLRVIGSLLNSWRIGESPGESLRTGLANV